MPKRKLLLLGPIQNHLLINDRTSRLFSAESYNSRRNESLGSHSPLETCLKGGRKKKNTPKGTAVPMLPAR